MITVGCGSTRFVVCIGNIAIKVARVKFIYWTLRFLHFRKHGGVMNKMSTMNTAHHFSVLRHLFAGVTANLEEVRFYREHPHLPLAPTILSLGLINIQVRGRSLKMADLSACPFRKLAKDHKHLRPIDLNKVENFGRLGNGQIVLLDYGNRELNLLLSEVATDLQVVYNF